MMPILLIITFWNRPDLWPIHFNELSGHVITWRHMRQRMASMINDDERSKLDSKQPINIMDSDDSNISNHVGDLDIQPYQFKPLCNDESQQEREHSTLEDSDIDESSH